MDAEDALIWVYVVGDDGVMTFTDFGMETLLELIRTHRKVQRPARTLRQWGMSGLASALWGTSNIGQTPQRVVRKPEMGLRGPMFDAGTNGGGSGFLAFLKS
jgi:hypothetical protein